jgi:hypothetical protein
VARRRREQSPISTAKLRPRHLATQHRDLVAQDQQLEVLGVQATATPNERSKQGSEREVEEREGHTGDPSSHRPDETRHDYWRRSRPLFTHRTPCRSSRATSSGLLLSPVQANVAEFAHRMLAPDGASSALRRSGRARFRVRLRSSTPAHAARSHIWRTRQRNRPNAAIKTCGAIPSPPTYATGRLTRTLPHQDAHPGPCAR